MCVGTSTFSLHYSIPFLSFIQQILPLFIRFTSHLWPLFIRFTSVVIIFSSDCFSPTWMIAFHPHTHTLFGSSLFHFCFQQENNSFDKHNYRIKGHLCRSDCIKFPVQLTIGDCLNLIECSNRAATE